MIELDRCKNCGAHPPTGLRAHPKFSVRCHLDYNGSPIMPAILYAHSLAEIMALAKKLGPIHWLDIQQWDGSAWIDLAQSNTLSESH